MTGRKQSLLYTEASVREEREKHQQCWKRINRWMCVRVCVDGRQMYVGDNEGLLGQRRVGKRESDATRLRSQQAHVSWRERERWEYTHTHIHIPIYMRIVPLNVPPWWSPLLSDVTHFPLHIRYIQQLHLSRCGFSLFMVKDWLPD